MRLLYVTVIFGLLADVVMTKSSSGPESKIIGGNRTYPGEYPPMISVGSEEYWCGGSVVNKDFILTAAHCCYTFVRTIRRPILVRAGVHDLKEETKYWQTRQMGQIFFHPKYTYVDPLQYHDLCLIQLNESLSLGTTERVLASNFIDEPVPAGTELTVFGWGDVTYMGNKSQVLLKANLAAMATDFCNNSFDGGIQEDSHLCTTITSKVSPCNGDSGGPLIWHRSNNTIVQVGIASWAPACGQKGLPVVFARVSTAIPWIHDVTTENVSKKEIIDDNMNKGQYIM